MASGAEDGDGVPTPQLDGAFESGYAEFGSHPEIKAEKVSREHHHLPELQDGGDAPGLQGGDHDVPRLQGGGGDLKLSEEVNRQCTTENVEQCKDEVNRQCTTDYVQQCKDEVSTQYANQVGVS